MSPDPILDDWAALLRRLPNRPLVLTTDRAISVAELDALAQVCADSVERSAADCPVVGLAADNGPGFLAGFLGLRRARRTVLLLDSRAPGAVRASWAAGLGAGAIADVAESWPRSGDWLAVRRIAAVPGIPAPPDGTAVLKLTSGSTGTPQAIAVTAEALLADDRQLRATMTLGDDERILAAVPLSHSYGLSSIALPAIRRGSSILVPDPRRPWGAFEAAHDLGATFVPAVPALLDAVARARRPPRPSPSLRLLVSAGAPLSPATARAVRQRWASPVHAFYGASECGGIAFDREGGAAERGTVGPPVEGVAIALDALDSESPPRVTVRSPAVATGYFPQPRPTLADGVYRTADNAAWSQGELKLLGRADDVINIKGKKVDPGEVEDVIRRLPGVLDVLVVAAPAPGGGELLKAVVVPTGAHFDPDAIRRYGSAHLSEHQIPRSVVVVPELPRNLRGKPDREAARAVGSSEPATR